MTLSERLMALSTSDPNTGCRVWLGAVAKSDGRGSIKIGPRRSRRPHLVAYELVNGPIPPEHELIQLCTLRLCIEPTHYRAQPFHKDRGKPEWIAWRAMLQRCTLPHWQKWYADRGIRVCARWLGYRNFLADVGRKPSPKHTLDRIDNDKGYEPGNCRWATWKEQRANRRG